MELTLCAPCLLGLEGLLGNELRHLGLRDVKAENGRVVFAGTEADAAMVNVRSRFAERVLIELGRFPAAIQDQLFEGVKALPWEQFIPRDGAFPVKGKTRNSALASESRCQATVQGAVAARLGKHYHLERLPGTGETYQIKFLLQNDEAALYLDTTGTALHKRGYRPAQVEAPLRETLAAAVVDIAGYRGKGDFADPFCGSGTIAIEAAMIAKNRAPGLQRRFLAETWRCFDKKVWSDAREEAKSREFDRPYRLFASDIDPKAVEIARQNAKRAGVEDLIRFEVADARRFSRETEGGVLVANPPYGERMLARRDAEALMRDFFKALRAVPGWDVNILTSDEELERTVGKKAAKVRKLYNGMIKCGYFMFKR